MDLGFLLPTHVSVHVMSHELVFFLFAVSETKKLHTHASLHMHMHAYMHCIVRTIIQVKQLEMWRFQNYGSVKVVLASYLAEGHV